MRAVFVPETDTNRTCRNFNPIKMGARARLGVPKQDTNRTFWWKGEENKQPKKETHPHYRTKTERDIGGNPGVLRRVDRIFQAK